MVTCNFKIDKITTTSMYTWCLMETSPFYCATPCSTYFLGEGSYPWKIGRIELYFLKGFDNFSLGISWHIEFRTKLWKWDSLRALIIYISIFGSNYAFWVSCLFLFQLVYFCLFLSNLVYSCWKLLNHVILLWISL